MRRNGAKGRPTGPSYEVTDDIVRGLEGLIESGYTQDRIAKDLSAELGHVVDPSTISNICQRRYPSSRLVRKLAEMYGWPLPPIARTGDAKLASAQAKLAELAALSQVEFDDYEELLDGALKKLRALAKIQRK